MSDYKKCRLHVEQRTFQIEFWIEEHFRLPYVRVSEVKTKTQRQFVLFGRPTTKEYLHEIDVGWTPNHDRVRWAVQRINQYLQNEKDVLAEAEEIKTFCDNNM